MRTLPILAALCGLASGGCVSSFGLGPLFGSSRAATLALQGTVSTPSGPWALGSADLCYELRILGSGDRSGCVPVRTDAAGSFDVTRDITEEVGTGTVLSAGAVTLRVGGDEVEGEVTLRSVSHHSLNGQARARIALGAVFRLPVAHAIHAGDPERSLRPALAALTGREEARCGR